MHNLRRHPRHGGRRIVTGNDNRARVHPKPGFHTVVANVSGPLNAYAAFSTSASYPLYLTTFTRLPDVVIAERKRLADAADVRARAEAVARAANAAPFTHDKHPNHTLSFCAHGLAAAPVCGDCRQAITDGWGMRCPVPGCSFDCCVRCRAATDTRRAAIARDFKAAVDEGIRAARAAAAAAAGQTTGGAAACRALLQGLDPLRPAALDRPIAEAVLRGVEAYIRQKEEQATAQEARAAAAEAARVAKEIADRAAAAAAAEAEARRQEATARAANSAPLSHPNHPHPLQFTVYARAGAVCRDCARPIVERWGMKCTAQGCTYDCCVGCRVKEDAAAAERWRLAAFQARVFRSLARFGVTEAALKAELGPAFAPGVVKLESLASGASPVADFGHAGLGPVGATAVAAALRGGGACGKLKLWTNAIGPGGAAAIAAAAGDCRSLRALNLNGCGVGDGGAKALASALVGGSALTHLDVPNNGLTSVGVAALAAALPRCGLIRLWLEDAVGDAGATALAAILGRCGLLELGLDKAGVGATGAAALAAAVEGTRLTVLSLRGNPGVGDAGAEACAAALAPGRCALTTLMLSGCGIGDAGARAIAGAVSAKATLQELLLDGNCIGLAGAHSLSGALATFATGRYVLNRNKSLRRLALGNQRPSMPTLGQLAVRDAWIASRTAERPERGTDSHPTLLGCEGASEDMTCGGWMDVCRLPGACCLAVCLFHSNMRSAVHDSE